jgi:hypothetical protein
MALADNAEPIEWSAARPLSWDDFVGHVPRGIDERRVAATNASLVWSYKYIVEWSRDACAFRITSIDSAALFNPDGSWVRPGHRTDSVLRHEQGHFDIAQLHKLRFETETREFLGGQRSCSGRNERQVTRSAEREIARLVGTIYEDVWAQYRREQEVYDRETSHGINSSSQAEWTKNIASLLEAVELR